MPAPLADATGGSDAAPAAGRDAGPDAVEEALCELLDDAFLRTDAHGIVRRANEAAAALLGCSTLGLRGRPLFGFVDARQQRGLRSLVSGLGDAAGARRETLRLCTATDQLVTVAATIAPVRDRRGTVVGARWLLRPLPPGATEDPPATGPARPSVVPADVSRYFVDFLTRVTAILGATLDQETMLRGLAHAAVPALGDWCFVDLVEGSGSLRRIAAAHTMVEDAGLVAPLSAAPRADGPDPAAVAVRARTTHLVPEVGPVWSASVASSPQHRAALERLCARTWLAVPLLARGQVIGALTFVMAASGRSFTPLLVDVAEEVARRAALSADNARLYRQAVRASETKSAFLGTISHELRTPLTAIIGYAELLQDGLAGPLAERQAEFVHRIRESSDHLLHLVEDVLGYTRLQAHEEHAELAPVDVGALAEQSLAAVTPLARSKGLALRFDRPASPLWLHTDAARLRQILMNLLGNAVKFTDRGEVRLRVLSPAVPAGPVTLEVCDTGVGIPPDLLPHVFDPFWQAEQSTTRARGGAGLGLSVVQQLARLLGGDVTVESEPERGSCFRIRLPAHASPTA